MKANRISETCAYFHSKYDKKFYDLVINGEVVRDNSATPREFPFYKKEVDFYWGLSTDKSYCNKVKIVYADWLVWRKIFIYDVIGSK